MPNQHRVGTILRFPTRRWYVCTSLCSQKYVLFSCGLILTDFSCLSSGAGINFDCPGNTDFFCFSLTMASQFLTGVFPALCSFSAVPTPAHTAAFDGNFYLCSLHRTQPTHRQQWLTVPVNNHWRKRLMTGFPSRFAFSANFAAPPQGWVMQVTTKSAR